MSMSLCRCALASSLSQSNKKLKKITVAYCGLSATQHIYFIIIIKSTSFKLKLKPKKPNTKLIKQKKHSLSLCLCLSQKSHNNTFIQAHRRRRRRQGLSDLRFEGSSVLHNFAKSSPAAPVAPSSTIARTRPLHVTFPLSLSPKPRCAPCSIGAGPVVSIVAKTSTI
jgi:hypothetical protein